MKGLPRILTSATITAFPFVAFLGSALGGSLARNLHLSDGPDHILFNWCSQDEGPLQAHAVWHIKSALLILETHDFLCHYFPEQGRKFASWRDD